MRSLASLLVLSLLFALAGCGFGSGLPVDSGDDDDLFGGDDDDDATDDDDAVDDDDATDDDDDATDDDDAVDDDDTTPPLPEDDATLVAAALPTALDCGASFSASVELLNTGTATWTRAAGYKLGTVDDEDPFWGDDPRVWLPEEGSVAPGESHVFTFELIALPAPDTYVTDWQMVHEGVTWFGEQASSSVVVTCSIQTYVEPLTDASPAAGFASMDVDGGSFSAAGWQTTSDDDQLVIALDAPIWGDATFEIDVTNFDPTSQYASAKHQIINMYTSDNGSQDVFSSTEAWWNIRTGNNYGTGIKVLAAPNGGGSRTEDRFIEDAAWNPSDVHTYTVEWDATQLHVYLDGDWLWSTDFSGRVEPLQYIFLGKDNVYVGQVGPIYSNLRLTY